MKFVVFFGAIFEGVVGLLKSRSMPTQQFVVLSLGDQGSLKSSVVPAWAGHSPLETPLIL